MSRRFLGFAIVQLFDVIPGWSEGPDPESRVPGFDAKPIFGPHIARTGWHRRRMTGLVRCDDHELLRLYHRQSQGWSNLSRRNQRHYTAGLRASNEGSPWLFVSIQYHTAGLVQIYDDPISAISREKQL